MENTADNLFEWIFYDEIKRDIKKQNDYSDLLRKTLFNKADKLLNRENVDLRNEELENTLIQNIQNANSDTETQTAKMNMARYMKVLIDWGDKIGAKALLSKIEIEVIKKQIT